jgi:Glycine rich protein
MRPANGLKRKAAGLWLAVAVGVAVAVTVAGAGNAKAPTVLGTFSTPRTYSWTVPSKVKSLTFDVFGARGGPVVEDTMPFPTLIAAGGAGGEAKASFAVTPGQVFEIVVGGQGGTAHGTTPGAGGSNGGGSGSDGGTFSCCGSTVFYGGGGGGGASDVRSGACAGNLTCGLSDRIVVGAGGGGGGGDPNNFQDGGAGGGVMGESGGDTSAATQSSGGICIYADGYAENGAFGVGGSASGAGGGGGGGWYGGGGGCTGHVDPGCGCSSSGQGSAGGGGSGFISGKKNGGSFPGGTSPSSDGSVVISTP